MKISHYEFITHNFMHAVLMSLMFGSEKMFGPLSFVQVGG